MADKATITNTLGIGLEYLDTESNTKTAYLYLPNPKTGLTETQIKSAVATLINNQNPILVNGETGAMFDEATAIVTAYTEEKEVLEIDIGVE